MQNQVSRLVLVQTCRLLRYKATLLFIQKILFGPAHPGTLYEMFSFPAKKIRAIR
jgi:hypothetical protein